MALEQWADRAAAWARGKDAPDAGHVVDEPRPERAAREVFICFDDDRKVRAPFEAQNVMRKWRTD